MQASDLSQAARILAVADSFDAMTSPRPYRKIMTRDEALQELKTCSGTQFDPKIVELFLNLENLDPNSAGLLQQAHSR